jgi:hypothetical protein
MFKTYVTTAFSRETLGTHATLDAALASLPGKMILWEEDPKHPGCYDVATTQGCYVVELAGA